ncbi:M12 family metallo-peptidase, partial [Saprospiraceae bacterium]|nr:M12 family metallo-peptidase [Saprospiraceae bacterium]
DIRQSSVFSDGLSAKYPSIHTYSGRSINGAKATIHMGISAKGFHAMILSDEGTYYIDKYDASSQNFYISYFRRDYANQQAFECLVEDTKNEVEVASELSVLAGDCTLRRYRLALACTGEYATFHGGTTESVLAEYAVAMTRVNGIYERDNGITMELIDNTDEIIFFDAATDPYTNNDGGTMLNQNQNTIDDIIGTANYDIGHVFSTGGGGIAQLNSPCGGGKARGVTGLNSPINDPFYVDYVCHEMGHQFGGNHTQNNNCNRNGTTSMEPGSANTIMGYAGICAPNTANNSDDHFHAISIQEIANFIVNGNGANCAEFLPLENNQPEISYPVDETIIPIGTSFILEATATDADNDNLTYCWEQMDATPATMPPVNTNDDGPAFLSIPPHSEPYRYFPNINAIVNNQIPTWEVIPFVSRDMNFRCTVRDNHAGLGCTDEVNTTVVTDDAAGPFLVMEPNTSVTWNSSAQETVNWDVSGTDQAPISCSNVDIFLSLDGGFTYPVLIEANVPNDGTHEITVPNVNSTTARIMVKCSDNIFFDISDENFTILAPFILALEEDVTTFCGNAVNTLTLNTETFNGFDETVALEFLNVPAGLTVTASENPVTLPNSVTISIENTDAAVGTYEIVMQATTSVLTTETTITVEVNSTILEAPTALNPIDGAIDLPTSINLQWNEIPNTGFYTIVVSTSPDFSENPLTFDVSNGEENANLLNLQPGTVYYWKLQAINECVSSDVSSIFAFQTAVVTCQIFEANDLQIEIDDDAATSISNDLLVEGVTTFSYMRAFVDIDHTWVGDLIATFSSPAGDEVVLFDQPGVPASEFGCGSDDLIVEFYDSSLNSAEDFEVTCDDFASNYQSLDPLSNYSGSNVNGLWTLTIEDVFPEDGGELDAWSLEFCTEGIISDGLLQHNALVLEQGTTKLVGSNNLQLQNSADEITEFVVLTLPEFGALMHDLDADGNFEVLTIGTKFTELDINNGLVSYEHNGGDNETDMFLYDAVDEASKWFHNEVFNIIISDGSLTAFAAITENILCNGGHNGIITIDVVGGTGPYMYSIDGENTQDSEVFTELTAGTYTITVTDANGIVVLTNEVNLTEPSLIVTESALDFYNIEVTAMGGVEPYMYSIDGENYQESNVFVKPNNALYTVFVKDANDCIQTAFITVDIPLLELGLISENQLLCFGDETASIVAEGVGGFEPYEYRIDGLNFSDETTFPNLGAGMYTLYIRDAGGLVVENQITITAPDQIMVNPTFMNNELTVSANGGTGELEYSIDNMNYGSDNIFVDYGTDPFTTYVVDENGCEIETAVIPLSAELIVREIDCFGDNNGELELPTQGGSDAGYEYSLNNVDFQEDNLFTDLTPGDYIVYVKDNADNTWTSEMITLIEPEELTASASFDGTSSILTITTNGGSGFIVYSFDGGSTFKDINTFEVINGEDITVFIKDENGCEIELLWMNTSNEEFELETGISIYPNPARNVLNIESASSKETSLTFINNLGQVVMTKQIATGSTSINIDHLPEGLYHILSQKGDAIFAKKLIVVR